MTNLHKALSIIAVAGLMVTGAFAQHGRDDVQHRSSGQHSRDWHWDDTRSFQGTLKLSSSQRNRISTINRRAAEQIRRVNQMNLSGQQRSARIAAIRAQARREIFAVLNSRQRSTFSTRGFGFDDHGRRGGHHSGNDDSGHRRRGGSGGSGGGRGRNGAGHG